MNALAPLRDEDQLLIHHANFMCKMVYILSVHGTFDHYTKVARNQHWVDGTLITGVVCPHTPQPHCRRRGHHHDGVQHGMAQRHVRCSEHGLRPQDHWAGIDFSTARAGMQTTFPQRPALAMAGLQGSQHSPDMPME
ncbi:hypothetical protein B0H16DRAFT_1469949 [Mycena metata]|uniref:Uncharacterized protein n=1 Tax=Mycena metata TaxID=1033252 RepID=A0AAD7HXL1_9AGAR|nr:hypothetical protein B0H16DRAFT_1469949 [Mycena metata]